MINIRPDSGQIYDALVGLIERKVEIPELGRQAADYVAKYHATNVVARQYEKLYVRILNVAIPTRNAIGA